MTNNCNEICAMLTNDHCNKRCLSNQRCLNSCKNSFYRNCNRINTKCDCKENCRIATQYFCSKNPRLYRQCKERMYTGCINKKCNTVNLNEYSNEGYNEGEKKGENEGYKKGEKKGRRKDCSYSVVYMLSIFTFIFILFIISYITDLNLK